MVIFSVFCFLFFIFFFIFLFYIAFCYTARGNGSGCNAKEGNPFGPFWDTFDVEFVGSQFYGPLHYDVYHHDMSSKWNEKYPSHRWPGMYCILSDENSLYHVLKYHLTLYTLVPICKASLHLLFWISNSELQTVFRLMCVYTYKYFRPHLLIRSQGNAVDVVIIVCIVRSECRFPTEARDFSFLQNVQIDWVPPSLLFSGYRGSFPGNEVAGAWNWPSVSI